jgi:hypothetical protein
MEPAAIGRPPSGRAVRKARILGCRAILKGTQQGCPAGFGDVSVFAREARPCRVVFWESRVTELGGGSSSRLRPASWQQLAFAGKLGAVFGTPSSIE